MIADEFDVCVKVEYKTADVEYSAVYSHSYSDEIVCVVYNGIEEYHRVDASLGGGR